MTNYIWGDGETKFFFELTPDVVLSAIDSLGFKTTGRCSALNSMENRVYEVEIDIPASEAKSPSDHFIVAKFYRPGRWNKTQIAEEHTFMFDLQAAEVPVVAPLQFAGKSLFTIPQHEIYYALFPKKGGRFKNELSPEECEVLGRTLARLHNCGEQRKAPSRVVINPENFGLKNLSFLLETKTLPMTLEKNYSETVKNICKQVEPLFKNIKTHRIHGDCHFGNMIWREEEGLFLVDFDDMLTGPAIQDIWLCTPGDEDYDLRQRDILLEAYESMRSFDDKELKLVEPLRTLRMMHFSTWIAKRYEDESFKKAFPHFGTLSYWESALHDLNLQAEKL